MPPVAFFISSARWPRTLGLNMVSNRAVSVSALGLAVLAGCAPYGSFVHGQVFEVVNPDAPMPQWRKVPVSGTFIVVRWDGTIPQPAHSGSVCLNTSITRTDERGQFTVPSWWALPKPYPVIGVDSDVLAYKPGYQQTPHSYGPDGVELILEKSQGSPKGRLLSLVGMSEVGCGEGKEIRDPGNNLSAYYRTLYEEARQLDVKEWEWMLNSLRRRSDDTRK